MKTHDALLDANKAMVRRLIMPLAKLLNAVTGGRLSPSAVTITALVMHVPIAWLVSQGYYGYAAGGLFIFGMFDALDGALARVQNSETPFGMLLDSVTDRVKEVMLYTGAAVNFVAIGRADVAYWAVLACGASLCVSYVNAWAEVVSAGDNRHAVNQAFRKGLARFEVRMFIFLAGLLTGRLVTAVMVIAVIATFTLIERLVRVARSL